MVDEQSTDDEWPTIADLDEMAANVAEVGCGDGYEADAWLAVIKLARAELERRRPSPRRPPVTFTPARDNRVAFTLGGYPLTTDLPELRRHASIMAPGDVLTFDLPDDVCLMLERDQLRAGLARMDAIYADDRS